jgi:hypothetical protein
VGCYKYAYWGGTGTRTSNILLVKKGRISLLKQ